MAPTLVERKKILNGGKGALPKILKAYMGEADLSTNPTRSIFGNLLRVVIMLFWQHDDQLKSGFIWIVVHINHWLPTKGRVSNTCVGGFGEQAISLEVRSIES